MNDEKWFGAKTLYRMAAISEVNAPGEVLYEERVVLIRARDFDEAIARGEARAVQYARDLGDAEYLGFIDVFEIDDDLEEGAEVYSLMRSSAVPPTEFLNRYYDDGTQRSQRHID